MRDVAPQLPEGSAPVDPQAGTTTVTQNELIRFRLTTKEKEQIASAAHLAETSVSALVRRAARDAAAGRPADHNLLADLVTIPADRERPFVRCREYQQFANGLDQSCS
jgi:uncharacterized protein (DUF1778 family)